MSIFQDNITSELLIKNVFDIRLDTSGFWQEQNSVCEEFFFKWVYNNRPERAAEGVIERIGNLPISLIEAYMKEDIRPLRRQFKKFIKHKYSHTNYLSMEGSARITITIEKEIPMFGGGYDIIYFKIILTRL